VNVLAAMVKRHTTVPYNFICMTDNTEGVNVRTLKFNNRYPGWWAKLHLFYTNSIDQILYIDLDTVIVGSIDKLLTYRGSFAIIKDWWAPGYNSSVMSIAPAFGRHVFRDFKPEYMHQMHGDQDWITQKLPNADLWQDIAPDVIGSYKANELEKGPRRYSLVCFHGDPKPHTFTEGWVHEHWKI
jgi:hypothetical protein